MAWVHGRFAGRGFGFFAAFRMTVWGMGCVGSRSSIGVGDRLRGNDDMGRVCWQSGGAGCFVGGWWLKG